MPTIFLLAATAAVMLFASASASAEQLSAEDQYVDTGPTGNGVGGPAGLSGPGPDSGTGIAGPGTSTQPSGDDDREGGSGSAGERADGDDASSASAAGAGEAGGGALPVFGYPLTPLVGLVLGLFAVALAVRIVTKLSESRLRQGA